jgi:colanic acid biosynthesis glycosyl transferase WcaI
MKVLIYSANFSPEPTGIGKYSGEMAEWLASQGHEVRVVCAPPYYPAWKVSDGYNWPPYRVEEWHGCKVWRAPIWVPRSPKGLTRVLHLISFAITSAPLMLRQVLWAPDVVFTVAPAFVCGPVGWLTAKLCGAASWLHIQDFEVDVAFRMGLLKGAFAGAFVRKMERVVMQRFDVVSTISGRMIEKLTEKGIEAKKRFLFPNWVDIEKIKPISKPSAYRAVMGIPEEAVVALFSGTLGSKQGLMVIPAAAKILAGRVDVHFVICGDGVMKADLERAVQGMPHVHMLPLQDIEMLPQLLGLADIHLLPQSPDAEDLVLPSKLTGMLSSGRPIIATCNNATEIANVVRQCGVVVPPEDSVQLARAIEMLADKPDLRLALGKAARTYAEQSIGRDSVLNNTFNKMQSLDGLSTKKTDQRQA